MSDNLDYDLYQRILNKDPQAMEQLYERYEKLVFSFSYKIMNDASLAEEVVQEVFIKLWRSHSPYSADKGKFSSWLLTMVRNSAMDLIRKNKKNETYEYVENDSLQVAEETPDSIYEWKENRSFLLRAVKKLKADQQEMIHLFYFKGLTQREIADRTQLPLGTVKGRIRLALKHLRGNIDEEGGQGHE